MNKPDIPYWQERKQARRKKWQKKGSKRKYG